MAIRFNKSVLVAIAIIAIATLGQYSKAQTTHVVGDSLGWIVPPNGATTYSNWAATKTFNVGDILMFNFAAGRHDVTQVTSSSFNPCTTTNPLFRTTNSPANITLTNPGAHYYICSVPGHCLGGQKLAINVSGSTSAPAPQPSNNPSPAPAPTPTPASAPTPTPTPAPSAAPTPAPSAAPTPTSTPAAPTPTPAAPTPAPTRQPVTHIVGDAQGWGVPPNTSVGYQNWASDKSFVAGDILVFNYVSGAHDVAEVTKAAYDSCNSSTTLSKSTNPPTRIILRNPGEHYYLCTVPTHCSLGQKLAINVTGGGGGGSGAPTGSPASPPSGATSPPPSGQSPGGGVTSPPPPPPNDNSAKSLGSAGLGITFLAAVVALLY